MPYYSAKEFVEKYKHLNCKICYVCCDDNREVELVNDILRDYFPKDHNIIVFYD